MKKQHDSSKKSFVKYRVSWLRHTVRYIVFSLGVAIPSGVSCNGLAQGIATCENRLPLQREWGVATNEWLYVFGFATHILSFKTKKPIGKTDIYNVLAVAFY